MNNINLKARNRKTYCYDQKKRSQQTVYNHPTILIYRYLNAHYETFLQNLGSRDSNFCVFTFIFSILENV